VEGNLRRLRWISLVFLISTAAYGQSAPVVPLTAGADACKYALIYKGASLLDSQARLGIWINLGLCQDWAEKHGDWQAAHNSFAALNSLYELQSTALKEQLYPQDNAPPVCKVFMDYQTVSRSAMMAGIDAHLPESEVLENVNVAEKNALAEFSDSLEQREQATKDLSDCSNWARESGLTVVALEVERLTDKLYEDDPGSIPASFEITLPVCKNAKSEADAILDFVNHTDDERIMPSDVEPYYHRATPLAHCAEQLTKTTYRIAYEDLLLAVMAVNNLMVIADGNSEAKLIHALSSQRPSSPVVIKIQNSYPPAQSMIQPTPSPKHCSGMVTNLGSFSTVDWNCY
jgi:hypothetical protein